MSYVQFIEPVEINTEPIRFGVQRLIEFPGPHPAPFHVRMTVIRDEQLKYFNYFPAPMEATDE